MNQIERTITLIIIGGLILVCIGFSILIGMGFGIFNRTFEMIIVFNIIYLSGLTLFVMGYAIGYVLPYYKGGKNESN